MYCPICGSKMEVVERKPKELPEPDWGNKKSEERYFKAMEDVDESIWWYCPLEKCFGEDYPLVEHHAPGFRFDEGKDLMRTKPGDSWSLTWLK